MAPKSAFEFHSFPIVLLLFQKENDYDFLLTKSGTWAIVSAKRVFPLKKGEKNEKFEKIHKEKSWKYGPGYFETKVVIQRNFAVQDAAIFAPAAGKTRSALFVLTKSF